MSKEEELSFEQAMDKLDHIVQRLEAGDVPLEQAIELFQEGMSLSKLCGLKLEQIEKKIEVLVEKDGELVRSETTSPADEQGELF